MRLRAQLKSMDVERVIIGARHDLLAVLGPDRAPLWCELLVDSLYVLYLILLTGFYLMAAVFLLIRSPAKARSEGSCAEDRGVSGNVPAPALRVCRRSPRRSPTG